MEGRTWRFPCALVIGASWALPSSPIHLQHWANRAGTGRAATRDNGRRAARGAAAATDGGPGSRCRRGGAVCRARRPQQSARSLPQGSSRANHRPAGLKPASPVSRWTAGCPVMGGGAAPGRGAAGGAPPAAAAFSGVQQSQQRAMSYASSCPVVGANPANQMPPSANEPLPGQSKPLSMWRQPSSIPTGAAGDALPQHQAPAAGGGEPVRAHAGYSGCCCTGQLVAAASAWAARRPFPAPRRRCSTSSLAASLLLRFAPPFLNCRFGCTPASKCFTTP